MRSVMIKLVVVALVFGLAPMALGAPADGNGNKFAAELDEEIPDAYQCGGGEWLDLHFGGWIQGKAFQGKGNRNIQLTVFHIILTFTNDEGDTFVYSDVGPDHAYIDKDGNFVVTITGRPGDVNGEGFALNGHAVVVNGELEWHAGKEGPIADDQACAAIS